MNMFHHSLYRQHNSKIMYLNKTRLDRSCLNDQAILLEYNTLKGVSSQNVDGPMGRELGPSSLLIGQYGRFLTLGHMGRDKYHPD